MFLARITEYSNQSLNDHAHNSAKSAEKDLGNIGLGNTAYLSALFHDCGKANAVFQQYLTDSFNGKNVKRGSVIHSFAGVYYFLNTYHNTGNEFEKMTSEIIACAIGSHHGMFDIFNPDKQNGFTKKKRSTVFYRRLLKTITSRRCSNYLSEKSHVYLKKPRGSAVRTERSIIFISGLRAE